MWFLTLTLTPSLPHQELSSSLWISVFVALGGSTDGALGGGFAGDNGIGALLDWLR